MKIKSFALWLLVLLVALQINADETNSLAGEWRFVLDRDDIGVNGHWSAQKLPNKIQLPGIVESQGYGDEISTRTPWVLSLYDRFWFLRAEYAAYTNAGNVKVPFLCQPTRHYIGAAWYQRDIEIPDEWSGKRVVLFLERPHWKSTVWLDDQEIGSDISLCVPHEYDFGIIPVGKHRLTIRVDNRMILPYRPDAHSVSDSLDDAWNGIIGKIELRATPPVWIENVRVVPNPGGRAITVKLEIKNLTGHPGSERGEITLFSPDYWSNPVQSTFFKIGFSARWDTNGGSFEGPVPIPGELKWWDEFNTAGYRLTVTLKNQHSTANVEFGLRDFHAQGNQFILNGHPMYFRGTHFGGDFPLTGYPPTDVRSWKMIFLTCKSYGLNHMRFHSWCPPEAAFEAADQVGFYLQIECGMWNEFSPGGQMEKQLYSETERILRHFGNHPSLMLVSASNEAHGNWKPVLTKWVKHFRDEDPRHLYTPNTGWGLIESPNEPINGGADYLAIGRVGQGRVRGERGWFGADYGDSIAGIPVPIISHEVGQWVAYPDFDVIKKFTGFMHPGNYEVFRDSAAAHGLLEQNQEFAWASGRFQLECYKEEIEANLRTPGMAGIQLLDLHDYTGQGTALVGLLDPMWGSKGYTTPEEFRKFCNTVVPLARLKQRVFTTAEKIEAPVEVANFSASALTNAVSTWEIHDANGKIVAHNTFPGATIPIGKNFSLGKISNDLSKLPAPAAYSLVVRIQSASLEFHNDWNFWLYPVKIPDSVPVNVLVTSSWDDAEKKLAAGGKVLFLPRNADLDWSSPPLARVPVFWNALMGPTWGRMLGLWCDTNHPALAEFPTEENCDWQWTELLRNTRAVNLDHLPKNLQPIVSAIDDWNRNYKLALIFEARVGSGKLLVCSADLNGNSGPVAQQLCRSLLDYMAGDKFQPKTKISAADFQSLHFNTRIMRALGATATADGRHANELVDGDPNTFWSSADARGNGPKPPHEIHISFAQPVAMKGLVLMPRQNHREHQGDIREFKLETSDDGTNWQQVANGQLSSTFDEQRISFQRIVTATQIKLTGLSSFGSDTSASLADLAVVYAGPKLASESSGNLEYKSIRTASPDIDAGDAPAKTAPKN